MQKNQDVDLVFTPYITLKDGHRLYAKQFGKKVFCFPRKKEQEQHAEKNE